MSVVTSMQAERQFWLFSKPRSGQTAAGFEESLMVAIGETLDVEASFKSKGRMPELTITAIARQARVRPSTLRYYEKIGVLPPAQRVGGRRRYDLSTLKQLELITYAKQAGFSLGQIQASGRSVPRKIARPNLARSRSGKGC